MTCTHLLWLPKIVVICSNEGVGRHRLRFYPRYHLDQSSLLHTHALPGPPLALDTQGEYLLEVTVPFEIRVYKCVVTGVLSPLSEPTLRLHLVRALSLMTPLSRPIAMALVPPRRGAGADSDNAGTARGALD